MTIDQLVYAVIYAVVYLAAYFLLKPDTNVDSPLDDSRTAASVRGSIAATSLGRNRVGATIGYVGNRIIKEENAP